MNIGSIEKRKLKNLVLKLYGAIVFFWQTDWNVLILLDRGRESNCSPDTSSSGWIWNWRQSIEYCKYPQRILCKQARNKWAWNSE